MYRYIFLNFQELVNEIDAQISVIQCAQESIRNCVQKISSHLSDRLIVYPGQTDNWTLENVEKLHARKVERVIQKEISSEEKIRLIMTSEYRRKDRF